MKHGCQPSFYGRQRCQPVLEHMRPSSCRFLTLVSNGGWQECSSAFGGDKSPTPHSGGLRQKMGTMKELKKTPKCKDMSLQTKVNITYSSSNDSAQK